MSSRSRGLLRKVATRQRLVSVSTWFYRLALSLAAAYAVLLLCSRLLGLIPDWFDLLTLSIVPAVALLAALLLHSRPHPADAARMVDSRMHTKDLFLTDALLEHAPGDYKPLVSKAAETQAAKIRPATVVPFNWWPPTAHLAVAFPLLLLGTMTDWQFDPFGRSTQRHRVAQEEDKLRDTTRMTKDRIKAMREKPITDETSKHVQQALEQLKLIFNQMKPEVPRTNLRQLNQQQKMIGSEWRKASEKKLKNSAQQRQMAQQFGGADQRLTAQWKSGLEAGKSDSLKNELSAIRDLVKQLAESDNPMERQRLRNQIQSRLENLADFLNNQASSQPLNAAMARALEQLQTSGLEGLSGEAIQGLDSTLELSSLELESLAQSVRDLKALEKALQTIGMAKQLNAQESLNGEACQNCQSIGDYAALYQQWVVQGMCSTCNGAGCGECQGTGLGQGMGQGQDGMGMGGQGIGRGNIAPEDNTLTTGFKTEKSQSAITAGSMLLEWKTQETAPDGEAREQYVEAIREVKQGVSEAILQEQIPPGYHDAIQKYFDSVDRTLTPGTTPNPTEASANDNSNSGEPAQPATP